MPSPGGLSARSLTPLPTDQEGAYQEALLPVEGGVHRVCVRGQQVERLPRQAQEPGVGLHGAAAERQQAPQLRQRHVGQGPLQREPLLQERTLR